MWNDTYIGWWKTPSRKSVLLVSSSKSRLKADLIGALKRTLREGETGKWEIHHRTFRIGVDTLVMKGEISYETDKNGTNDTR